MALRQSSHSLDIQGPRGDVVDREGRTLAVSVDAASVGIRPAVLRAREDETHTLVKQIAAITKKPAKEVRELLAQDKPFVWLGRGMPENVRNDIATLDTKGIEVFSDFRRYYPQGSLAGSLLGRVARDGQGQSGIELAFDTFLSAPSQHVAVSRDARGRFLTASLSDNDSSQVRAAGGGLQLTIDAVIQGILEEEFVSAEDRAHAKAVFGLVMDADTGEILALGQSPHFNPNKVEDIAPSELENKVLQVNYEPGSTMKPLVAAMALEEKKVSTKELLDCENGSYTIGSHTIRDVHPVGVVTLRDVLVRSSNICMAKIGRRMGASSLHDSLEAYGFGERARVGLPGEAKGILRPVSDWAEIDSATHAFGQGVAVTAIQLARAYAAIANGGLLVEPKLIADGRSVEPKRILSAATARKVFEMLYGVTEDEHGTARQAAISGLRVSGKTGTAQKNYIGRVGYDPDRVVASFVGSIDGSALGVNRRLTALVVVDEPQVKPRWGGVVAGPVFKNIMERTVSYLLTKSGGLKTALREPNFGKTATRTVL